jgi:Uma2 family endonuclease
MAKHMDDEVAYYYDSHPTEEDLMGETRVHSALVHYLMEVLAQVFRGQLCALYENFNFYQTANPKEYPLVPDIAVIKGIEVQDLRSWRVGKTGPTPQVVFEIASEETWHKDLEEKPERYARMGVKEYFAYDPYERPLRRTRTRGRRLFGWQLDQERRVMRELLPVGPDGRIWSFHLESWLVPDGKYLRLYDNRGNLRLTQAEAEARRAETEAKEKEAAIRWAEAEARRAEEMTRQKESLAEKLRSLGIDPDQISF